MSEDLAKQLASYKAQLQQVEAALSGNADNEDLLKLKKDLQEVIELTKDLLSTQPSETLASSDSSASALPSHSWKVGDRCMAIWSEDGQCYEAEIEEIDEENGTAAVTFAGYGNAEVTPLFNLKPVEEGRKAKEDSGNKPMSKKEMIAQQREYKKKKALKKAQRIKELEQEREDQKVKWQQFNNRAYSKNKKGQWWYKNGTYKASLISVVTVLSAGLSDKLSVTELLQHWEKDSIVAHQVTSAIVDALIGGDVHQLPESQLKLNSTTGSLESMHRKKFSL